jgi:hypothetical protein
MFTSVYSSAGEEKINKPKNWPDSPYKKDRDKTYYYLRRSPYYADDYEGGYNHSFDFEIDELEYVDTEYVQARGRVDRRDIFKSRSCPDYHVAINSNCPSRTSDSIANSVFNSYEEALDMVKILGEEVYTQCLQQAEIYRKNAEEIEKMLPSQFEEFQRLLPKNESSLSR